MTMNEDTFTVETEMFFFENTAQVNATVCVGLHTVSQSVVPRESLVQVKTNGPQLTSTTTSTTHPLGVNQDSDTPPITGANNKHTIENYRGIQVCWLMALAPTFCQYTFSGVVVQLAPALAETDTSLLSLSRRDWPVCQQDGPCHYP